MAGTNPNIKLLIDLMSKNKIYGEEAAQLIMTFPMYIATPTNELLKYFFVSSQSSMLSEEPEPSLNLS